MKKDQKQIQARVLKKLSALRATLSNDERAVLDNFIVIDNEVKAHKLTTKSTDKVKDRTQPKVKEVEAHKMTGRTTTKTQDRTTPKSVEVEAHRMTGRTTTKTQDRTTPKSVEVEAHRMTGRTTSKTTSRTTSKTPPPSLRIAFDQDAEEYKIIE